MQIHIINGPNLNLLGKREPEIYGSTSFEDHLRDLRARFPGVEIEYFQSNREGQLIDKLQEIGFRAGGIVLNAGGLTHTSVALADAVAAIPCPVVEVHISNVFGREPFRHHSFLSPHCQGVIVGFGLQGYDLALRALLEGEGPGKL